MATTTKSAKKQRQQPESLRLRGMMPSYTVNDITKSVAWYQDGLGFYVSERWEEDGKLLGVMLKAGACQFGLSQDDFSKGRDRVKGLGFRLWCESTQDIDSLAARLKAHGGKIIDGPGDLYDRYGFTAEDPDGYRITLTRAAES
jgi:predicted lactoylglutathione lyase